MASLLASEYKGGINMLKLLEAMCVGLFITLIIIAVLAAACCVLAAIQWVMHNYGFEWATIASVASSSVAIGLLYLISEGR